MPTADPRTGGIPGIGGPTAHPVGIGGGDELVAMRKLVAMCSHLSAATAQQTDLETVVQFLAAQTNAAVAVLDRSLEILAADGSRDPGELVAMVREHDGTAGLDSVLAAAARHRRALTLPRGGHGGFLVVAPVSVGDEVAGYLLTVGDDATRNGIGEDLMLLASEHGAMVCGVMLGRELVVTAAAGRARHELVEALLLGRGRDDGDVGRWARHLGVDASRDHAVMAVALVGDGAPGGHPVVEGVLARLLPEAVVAGRDDEVVAIVPTAAEEPGDVLRRLAQRCLAALADRGLRIRAIGIGNPYPPATAIARSYHEARRAVTAGERMGPTAAVVRFADLGIHRLLVRYPDVGELRTFAEEVLGRLIEEEHASGMEYFSTLSTYFAENSSPRRTARRLHVHPNTVGYRIRRIEEITGLRLDVHRDRLMAEVAVEILSGLGRGA